MLLLSVGSIWEIQIKLQLGKVKLNRPLSEVIESQRQANNLELLPVNLEHVLALETLPDHHKDPFDRLLIAQAIVEHTAIVSADPIFKKYPITVVW
jgi:PIN domain nuclease of toxin-antitoxin system